jgi:hypothetical protein
MGHKDIITKLLISVTEPVIMIDILKMQNCRRNAVVSKKARRNQFKLILKSRKCVGRDRVLPCLPMGTTIAHLAGRNTRASQAEEVCSSDNGNAHLSIDIATHNGVRLLPLLSQERVLLGTTVYV